MKLKDHKRELFCREYIIDFKPRQAALRAGYAEKSASATACKLLDIGDVQERIEELTRKAINKTEITVDRVLKEYEKIAFSNIKDMLNDDFTIKDLGEIEETAMISYVDVSDVTFGDNGKKKQVKIKLHNKLDALNSLANYLEMFKERNHPDQTVDFEYEEIK